jgi:ABC-type proline/glycine betaine transport system ATPase subunit
VCWHFAVVALNMQWRATQIDAGHVAEMDTPQHLLQNPDSKFTALVRETGEDSDAKLRAIAQA